MVSEPWGKINSSLKLFCQILGSKNEEGLCVEGREWSRPRTCLHPACSLYMVCMTSHRQCLSSSKRMRGQGKQSRCSRSSDPWEVPTTQSEQNQRASWYLQGDLPCCGLFIFPTHKQPHWRPSEKRILKGLLNCTELFIGHMIPANPPEKQLVRANTFSSGDLWWNTGISRKEGGVRN